MVKNEKSVYVALLTNKKKERPTWTSSAEYNEERARKRGKGKKCIKEFNNRKK